MKGTVEEVLQGLRDGSLKLSDAVSKFGAHRFSRDPARGKVNNLGAAALDTEEEPGAAEFDVVTNAYIRDELTDEQFEALSEVAAKDSALGRLKAQRGIDT